MPLGRPKGWIADIDRDENPPTLLRAKDAAAMVGLDLVRDPPFRDFPVPCVRQYLPQIASRRQLHGFQDVAVHVLHHEPPGLAGGQQWVVR
jgi:hypothetical protein